MSTPVSGRDTTIYVFSTLFPSQAQPTSGLFVRERAFRLRADFRLVVISPQPWFPFQSLIRRFNVKAGGPGSAAKSLSGGNLQKFIVGREIDAAPKLLVVSQPTWGVDVGAAAQIRGELLALRDAGCAVLVVSEELDELFEICDRLLVVARGRVSPSVARRAATVEQIGEWMSGLWGTGPPCGPLPQAGEGGTRRAEA